MPDFYKIKRIEVFEGKKLRFGESKNSFIRLSKIKPQWQGAVHEEWIHEKGTKGVLKNPLLHYSSKDLTDFVNKINSYTDISSKNSTRKSNFLVFRLIFYPPLKFLQNYILKQGFRDGTHGFVHACLMSFHSFLDKGKRFE